MKRLFVWVFTFTLFLNACTEASLQEETPKPNTENNNEQVLNLIQQTLIWADSENSINLLPIVLEDSIYTRFDLDQHQQNLNKLSATSLFSQEFINNYDNIILHLDKKLRNGEFEYGPWYLGDLPPFNFASEANPWCNCQDNASWESIQIKHLGEKTFIWSWGQRWKDFKYQFRVSEEDGKLKIAYMEGFEIEK